MIDIRPLREEDLPDARKLLPPDAAQPDWPHCYVVLDNIGIAGIMGTEVRLNGLFVGLVAEPLYMARTGASALVALGWLDGLLRAIAAANGLGGYSFSTRSERFQQFVERHLQVRLVGQAGGAKQYWRQFS